MFRPLRPKHWKTMDNNIKKQVAFTLIELLVVIAIIGILSALIVVGMSSTTQKATIAKTQVFSNSLRNSLMNNIVAQYSFDDIDSSDYDPTTKVLNNDVGNVPDSWLDNEGRAYNGPTVKDGSDCVSGKCLSFDGSDDFVNAGMGLNVTGQQLTIGAWAKTTSWSGSSGYAVIAENYQSSTGGYFIEREQSNNYFFLGLWTAAGFKPLISTEVLAENKWFYLVGVFNGTYTAYYVNGISKATDSFAATVITSSNSPFVMGGRTASNRFNGLIDDVRIYNAAMPTSQIQQNYFAGLNKLFAKQGIESSEYQQGLVELSNNYAKE